MIVSRLAKSIKLNTTYHYVEVRVNASNSSVMMDKLS